MKPSQLATIIKEAIEGIEPANKAHDGDRFRGLVAEDPGQAIDRCFSVSLALPNRNPDLLDPGEHVIRGAVAVAYLDSPEAYSRMVDDAAEIVEVLCELADGAELLSLLIDDGVVQDGPVEGTLLAFIPFTARYRYS